MIRLRDHYFIAWLKVFKGINFIIDDKGVQININNTELEQLLAEYEQTLKPLFKEVRKTVKILSKQTPISNK